jgi:hypothetical protein
MDQYCDEEGHPENWVDPLELYGDLLDELREAECNLTLERQTVGELIAKHGSLWVWRHRQRLAATAKAFKNYPKNHTKAARDLPK